MHGLGNQLWALPSWMSFAKETNRELVGIEMGKNTALKGDKIVDLLNMPSTTRKSTSWIQQTMHTLQRVAPFAKKLELLEGKGFDKNPNAIGLHVRTERSQRTSRT